MVGPKSKYLILACLLCLGFSISGQSTHTSPTTNIDTSYTPPLILQYQSTQTTQTDKLNTGLRSPFENWGFVCKWENNNDKQLQMPIRFRLGTLDYVNKLEGKN